MTRGLPASAAVVEKWRPRLALVLALVLGTVLLLPLAGLSLLRVYDGELMRQAEAELIAQGAALAAVVSREAEAVLPPDATLGPPVPVVGPGLYDPIEPSLDLAGPVLPPRPEATAPASPPEAAFAALGERISPLLVATQRTMLAGFRLLDVDGRVIAGRGEVGRSLADVPEVARALSGHVAEALRRRISKHPDPGVESLSRGTTVRVFVALPVVARGRVAGALYLSRTPSGTLRGLYRQRHVLVAGAAAVLAVTFGLGLVLYRAVSVPVRDLLRLARAVAAGDRSALHPGRRQGTREFADLSRGLLDMAARLVARSDAVSSFAAHVSHELKSPLSAIRGAAELLRDDLDDAAMSPEERRRFLDNVAADAARLDALLGRLREMAFAEDGYQPGETALGPLLPALRERFGTLDIHASGDLDAIMALSGESLLIALAHLCDNAVRHGAGRVDIRARTGTDRLDLEIVDDGAGISPGNRARVFDAFFTTRRADGGTGMGLAIVRALLGAQDGTIVLMETDTGAGFRVSVPVVRDREPARNVTALGGHGSALVAVAIIVGAGLALRGFGPAAGLPFAVTKYGGSVLWGAMVHGIVSTATPRASVWRRIGAALLVAITVELIRLVEAPALDAFRSTPAGALLLGRVFSPWNIAAYLAGIGLFALGDAAPSRRGRTRSGSRGT